MPRVHHVKSARKKNPVADVGEPYYWWKFRYGGKQFSKTRPRPSQLTQSNFLSRVLSMQEAVHDGNWFFDLGNLDDDIQDIRSEIEDIQSECQDSLDAMPYELQDTSSSGELLNERIENCTNALDALDSINLDEAEELREEIDRINEAGLQIPAECQEAVDSALTEVMADVVEAIDQCLY